MTDLSQPHDLLFKEILSHPETAGALLREFLPPMVAALLAPDPPQLVDGSFVEERLRPFLSDRLFQARTLSGKPLFIYVLIEHKSYEDEKVGWQLYRGMSAFLDQKTREDEQWRLLPAILPLVFYHGARVWRIPREFLALVDADEALRPWLLNFNYTMVDVGPIPDAQLSRHARLRVGLLALKYGVRHSGEQMAALETIISAIVEAPELLPPTLLYLMTTFDDLTETWVRTIIERVKPEEAPAMMSVYARELIARGQHEGREAGLEAGLEAGREAGIKVGRQEGESHLLMVMLRHRFGVLPDWVAAQVTAASAPTLEEWSRRVLEADSLEAIFK